MIGSGRPDSWALLVGTVSLAAWVTSGVGIWPRGEPARGTWPRGYNRLRAPWPRGQLAERYLPGPHGPALTLHTPRCR